MVLASTSVRVVEWAPHNGFCQSLCPQGDLQLPPAFLGDCLRSTGWSDPGSYQMTASAWGPGMCEILCAAFNIEVSIPPPFSGTPRSKCSQISEPNDLGDFSLLSENLCNCDYSLICGSPTLGYGTWLYHDLPLLLVLLWFPLYVFSCKRSFRVGSSLFHWWLFYK